MGSVYRIPARYDPVRTMAKLRESEERFRNLTAAAFEGIGISENGRIVDANDQLLRMFGYERSEIIGREVIEVPSRRSIVFLARVKLPC